MATQSRDGFVATQSPELEAVRRPTAEDIEEWLSSYLSNLLGIDPEKIGSRISFARYGLDSSGSIALTSELGDWLGRDLDPTINYAYPTIEALAKHLAE